MIQTRPKPFIPLMLAALLTLAACGPMAFGRGIGVATSSDERVAELRGEVARNPTNLKALNALGREYARQGQWQRAAGSYREALIVNSGDRTALLGFSATQSALGNYSVALSHADRTIGRRVQTDALILRGVALTGMRRMTEARAAFDAAARAAPRDLDARNNLALTLAMAGDGSALPVMRNVAFAPNADLRHKRNYFLVASILGQESAARADSGSLGIPSSDIDKINAIGRNARNQGVSAFGLATIL